MSPVWVLLSGEARRALLASVPDTSRAWAPITDAVELAGTSAAPTAWIVACDFESAMTLLCVSLRGCPEAAQAIVDGVNRSL